MPAHIICRCGVYKMWVTHTMHRFGTNCGLRLDRFWTDSRAILGAFGESKSIKNHVKNDAAKRPLYFCDFRLLAFLKTFQNDERGHRNRLFASVAGASLSNSKLIKKSSTVDHTIGTDSMNKVVQTTTQTKSTKMSTTWCQHGIKNVPKSGNTGSLKGQAFKRPFGPSRDRF